MPKKRDRRVPGTEAKDPLRESLTSCRGCFLGVGVLSMAINLLMLTTSLYMMQVFDRGLSSGSKATLLYLPIVAGGDVLLLSVLDSVRGRSLGHVSRLIQQNPAP